MEGKESLSNKITNELREEIIYGKFKPGEIITVRNVARHYNVSTTPVRDAVNRLVQDGLLNTIPYKGYIVSQINIKELKDLFTVRMILESNVIDLLPNNLTSQQINELTSLALMDFNENNEGNEIAFMRMNHQFHVKLAELTDNLYLTQLISDILEKMQRILYMDLKKIDLKSMRKEHLELIELIKRRDVKRAQKMVISHIEESRHRVFGKK